MVERWKQAGMPQDEDVRHPFSVWARVIGGILKVSGFKDFLANYGTRKTSDDPLRRGLGLLGIESPNKWLPASEWAKAATDAGLIKTLIPESDRENDVSRARGLGVVISAHADETFLVETDLRHIVLKLEKKRKRLGGEPHVCYRFIVVNAVDLPGEDDLKPDHRPVRAAGPAKASDFVPRSNKS